MQNKRLRLSFQNIWRCAITIWLTINSIVSFAQQTSSSYLNSPGNKVLEKELNEFYQSSDSQSLWFRSGQIPVLLKHIKLCGQIGLGSHISFPEYDAALTLKDSLTQDTQLTRTALRLMEALHCGFRKPAFRYDGLQYTCSLATSGRLLLEALQTRSLNEILEQLSPRGIEYDSLTAMLGRLISISGKPGFSDIFVSKPKTGTDSLRLMKRLAQFELIEGEPNFSDTAYIRNVIKKAQLLFDLEPDGIVGLRTINAINIPIAIRIRELESTLDFIRWSRELKKKQSTIFLNIPAAKLKIYQNGTNVLESKVIVGKASTPTPMLTGIIDEIVLYPFWMVPYNIATREMLPDIRRDNGFLERGNYQILNRLGKIVKPANINWYTLSTSYFPYVIRQSTGCDNALGTIKFDFDNPFAVYLHDTPGKELFRKKSRFFSHGCMRVEKPVDLAHLLLKDNRIAIDTLTEKGCLLQQKPIPVSAKIKTGLIVHYNTAWYDYQAGVIFYSDVYSKFGKER
jgi:murein L,D-transpeptidase YcbB/YkuD